MVNIDHVNGNHFLRIPLYPLLLPVWLLRLLSCRNECRRYLKGTSILSAKERYGKLFSYLKSQLFFRRRTYTFIYGEKILQIQAIFVVDGPIDWESMVVLKYLSEKHGQKLPTPLLHSLALRGRPPMLWNLVDARVGENEMEEAIGSGRSLLVEKDMLISSARCSNLVKASRLPIIPIHTFSTRNRSFHRFGGTLRATDLIRVSDGAFSNILENAFGELRKKFLEDIRRSEGRRSGKRKFLFF